MKRLLLALSLLCSGIVCADVTGVVTPPGGTGTVTNVTNAQLAPMPANTFKCNANGTSSLPQDCTTLNVSAISGTLPVANGGTNAATLSGILKGNGGTSPVSSAASSDIIGLWSGTCTPSATITLGTDGNCYPFGAGNGTVTSVGATSTNGTITITGTSPITNSGTFNFDIPTSYLASPPAIGGTVAAAGSFTSLISTGGATIAGGASSINKNNNFTTEIGDGSTTSQVTIGNPLNTTLIGGSLSLGNGAVSAASWTTNGIGLTGTATTFTDTTGTGTIVREDAYAFPAQTIAATNAGVTISNLATLFLPTPIAGTNVTATNLWALDLLGGLKVSGVVNIGSGAVTIVSNNNNTVAIGTGTDTQTVTIGGGSNAVTVNATTLTLGGSTLLTSSSPSTFSNATIKLSGLATSSAAQTGTVCSGTAGLLTVDTTTTCLLSDGRHKMNVDPLTGALVEIMQFKPVSYDLKPDVNPTHLGRQVGLIAQDVIKIDPRLASIYQSGPDKGTPSGVRYEQMVALLVKAIQEQQQEIDFLKKQLKVERH